MHCTCIPTAAAAFLFLSLSSAAAQETAPKPVKVKKDMFKVQCRYGAADSSRAPIAMLYGLDAAQAATRVRTAFKEAGLEVAKDGFAYWTTVPVDRWPADQRGDAWRAFAHPGVYAQLVLGKMADTVVVFGSATALCATSPGAPDSTIATAVNLFAAELTAALQRHSPMPTLSGATR
jgi:hypothetical protein